MEIIDALEAFACLSQETRLRAFKLLIQFGKDGAAAGKLAEELEIPDNTLSFHLAHMTNAGLVSSERSGRSIIYFANTALMLSLIGFLKENCCVREAKLRAKAKC